MDKETFDKICRFSEKMKSIEAINRQMEGATISFIGSSGYDVIIPFNRKKVIQDILSRHEAEIRKEINDRYNGLKKQIEKL